MHESVDDRRRTRRKPWRRDGFDTRQFRRDSQTPNETRENRDECNKAMGA